MTGIDVNAIPTVEELQAMFIEGARASIAELDRQCRAASSGETSWEDAIVTMRGIAHDIKGQGGSFGYPLITQIGNSLSTLLKHEQLLSEAGLELLGEHVSALGTILDKAIEGDGGNLGGRYVERLCAMVERL